MDPSLSARVVMHYSDLMRDEITDGRRYNLMVVHGWLRTVGVSGYSTDLRCPGSAGRDAHPTQDARRLAVSERRVCDDQSLVLGEGTKGLKQG